MEVRNCQFCENPTTYAPLDQMENFGIKVYFCHPCQSEYLYLSREGVINETPSSFSLYTTINNKMYRWTRMAGGGVHVWLVKKPGIPGIRINSEMESVVYIEEDEPFNINPQNIQVKLQIWLPFL